MTHASDKAREALAALPVRTEILNVDTGERGAQSVVLPIDLRDQLLAALSTDSTPATAPGEVCEACGGNGYSGGKVPPEDWLGEYDCVCEVCLGSGEQPPQHPGTDTPAIGTTVPEHLRWQGEGPAPARWTAADGTIVYRSYEDYCDD